MYGTKILYVIAHADYEFSASSAIVSKDPTLKGGKLLYNVMSDLNMEPSDSLDHDLWSLSIELNCTIIFIEIDKDNNVVHWVAYPYFEEKLEGEWPAGIFDDYANNESKETHVYNKEQELSLINKITIAALVVVVIILGLQLTGIIQLF